MNNKTFLVFHIVGYDTKLDEDIFTNKVVIRLIDKTLDSAMERAKNIVSKKFWFLAEVVEYESKNSIEE